MLLDTHFLLWILLGSTRLTRYPWLGEQQPWIVSPVSLLEIQFLSEVGKLEVDSAALTAALGSDPRFVIDDLSLALMIRNAVPLGWSRDPFDRLLVAHSSARRLDLCSLDRSIRTHHRFVPEPLRLKPR